VTVSITSDPIIVLWTGRIYYDYVRIRNAFDNNVSRKLTYS
jgi:hypothetical protein